MNVYKNSLVVFLLTYSSFIYAQKNEVKVIVGDSRVKLALKKVEQTSDGVSLFLVRQEVTTDKGSVENYLTQLDVDASLNIRENFLAGWTPNNYNNSIPKVKELYKDDFKVKVIKNSFSNVTTNELTYIFDKQALGYYVGTTENSQNVNMESIPSSIWQGETKNRKFLENPFVDLSKGSFTNVFGNDHKGKGSDKWSIYKDLTVTTYNTNGKIKNIVPIKTEFPRDLLYSNTFFKVTTPDAKIIPNDGYLYVFHRVNGIGKKNNDPDDRNYHVVLVDEDGKEIFNYKFQFGNEKNGGGLVINDTKKIQESVVAFARVVDSKPGIAFIKFDKTATSINQFYLSDELSQKYKGEESGYLKLTLGNEAYVNQIMERPNGDYVVIAQNKYVDSKNIEEPALGGGTITRIVKTYIYSTLSVFVFDKTGQLKNYSGIPLANNSEPYDIQIISDENNQLNLFVEKKLRIRSSEDAANFRMFASPNNLKEEYNNFEKTASILSLNLENGVFTKKPEFDDNFVIFNENAYKISANKDFCYLFGREINKNGQITLVVKKIKL